MAGLIIVCEREGGGPAGRAADVRRCAASIVPDDVAARPPLLWAGEGVVSAAVAPGPGTLLHAGSVAVGYLYDPAERWWEPGEAVPDGAFALCRVDARHVELVTDLYASRTLWYALTDDLFVASSSPRAVVALLGGFELNDEAVSWMLSSGYLPPGAGWDRRLRRVPPACRLTLDRRAWKLGRVSHAVPIAPDDGSEEQHIARLRDAVLDAGRRLDVPWDRWRLALSGGMDSRAILVGLLRAGRRPTCITWGRAAARNDPRNDAAVAERVAARAGLPHHFYPTDFTGEPLERVLGRFVAASAGSLDHFEGYTDGFAMWRQLFEAGVEGVVRGDEPTQGYQWHYASETLSRLRAQAHMVADYPPGHPIHRLGLAPQTWPTELRRQAGESPSAYTGRLFCEFWSPAMISPLNDVKALYVEVANPLLSRGVVVASHTMAESLRRGRRAMTAVLASMETEIPFAHRSAPLSRATWLAQPGFAEELRRVLSSPTAAGVFSDRARATLLDSLCERPAASLWARVRPRVKEAVPSRLSGRLKPRPRLTAGGCSVAFRAYVAVRTIELLRSDAVRLGSDASRLGGDPAHPAGDVALLAGDAANVRSMRARETGRRREPWHAGA